VTQFESSTVALTRDCAATMVPGGQTVVLPRGEVVVITQSLGGSFTVQTEHGYLARINAVDADALGLEVAEPDDGIGRTGPGGSQAPFDLERVIDQLKSVFDPEIPINVVDLGLIYACDAEELPGGGHRVEIKMSMTAPGCGMGDVLREDALARVQGVPGVSEVDVELVWDPPWDQSRMSEAALLELGMY
jgi:probable FeS assembly SUF system protein SufT